MCYQKKVVIAQNLIPHYRVSFFEELHTLCAQNNISLSLLFNSSAAQRATNDYRSGIIPSHDQLTWATPAPIRWILSSAWQPAWKYTRNADLFIFQQELKYVSHFLLLFLRKLQRKRTALWGHGRNFQSLNQPSPRTELKGWLATLPDWWFSYTNLSTSVLASLPYPQSRITTLNNSLDTERLKQNRNAFTQQKADKLRRQLNLPSHNVAVFAGGLHQFKRIPFLIESALLIKKKLPDFHLLIIGSGPESHHIPELPWIKKFGSMDDDQKVPYWMLAQVVLMPGTIGLAAVDSLCLETPIITTDYPFHSPEICYIKHNHTCIISTPFDSPSHFAASAAALLGNPTKLAAMQKNCRDASPLYSSQKMARNFLTGIQLALQSPPISQKNYTKSQ